ncbi:hypothetical protein N9W79_00525 [bacterium]|nr:hypothetical protein [bacterium]
MSEVKDLPKKILIIDKEANVASKITDPFDKIGIQVRVANDFQTAKYRFDKEFYKVVFISAKFEEHDALDLIQRWRKHEVLEKRHAAFVILSQYEVSKDKVALIEEISGVRILAKPLAFGSSLNVLKECMKYTREKLQKESVQKKIIEQFDDGEISVSAAIALTYTSKDHLQDYFYPLMVDLHKIDESLPEAKNLLENAPSNALEPLKMYNLKGEVYLKLGEHKNAKECFLKADALAPRNMERINKLVDTFLELKQPDMAIMRQKELLSMSPDNKDLKFDMFKKLEKYGYSKQAVEFCREVSNPLEVVKYFNNKGVSLSKSGSPAEAISEYERALSYFPKSKKNYLIHYNIALSLVKTKNKKNLKVALVQVEKSLNLKTNFFKAQDLKDKILEISKNVGILQAP